MTSEEHAALTENTIKLIDKVNARLAKLRATLVAGKIYGAFENVYDAAAELGIIRNRVSALSAGKQDTVKVKATPSPKTPVPVDDEPPSC